MFKRAHTHTTHTHARTHTHTHTHMHAHTHTHTRTHTHTHTSNVHTHTRQTCTRKHYNAHTCTHNIHTCMKLICEGSCNQLWSKLNSHCNSAREQLDKKYKVCKVAARKYNKGRPKLSKVRPKWAIVCLSESVLHEYTAAVM